MARLTVVLAFAVHASTHAIPVDVHSRLRNMADSMADEIASLKVRILTPNHRP